MTVVYFADEACEDLRAIPQPWVAVEIIQLARRELKDSPDESPIEGTLKEHRGMWRRRAVRRSDLERFLAFDLEDEERCQACDYSLVYRRITTDEAINLRLERDDTLVVVRICHNRDLAPWM